MGLSHIPWLTCSRINRLTMFIILSPISVRILLGPRHHSDRIGISYCSWRPINSPSTRNRLCYVVGRNHRVLRWISRRDEVLRWLWWSLWRICPTRSRWRTRLVMHQNLHLTYGKGMQFLAGQIAYRRPPLRPRHLPNRYQTTVLLEDYIAFLQVMGVHPSTRKDAALILRWFNVPWNRTVHQVIALDHPERMVRRRRDLAHIGVERDERSIEGGVMTALDPAQPPDAIEEVVGPNALTSFDLGDGPQARLCSDKRIRRKAVLWSLAWPQAGSIPRWSRHGSCRSYRSYLVELISYWFPNRGPSRAYSSSTTLRYRPGAGAGDGAWNSCYCVFAKIWGRNH